MVQGQICTTGNQQFLVTSLMPAVKDALPSAEIFRNYAFYIRVSVVFRIILTINDNYFSEQH
jgi:hypothetical protein